MNPSARRRALTLLLGVLLGLGGLFAFPAGAAQAHAAVVGSDPRPGSVVATAPSEIVVSFTESVQPVVARISVIDPDGKRVDTGHPRVVGNDLRIPVRTDGPQGTYLVSFRVISDDSHPVGGGFTYSVGAPSPGGAPTAQNAGRTDPVVATTMSIAQLGGFVGLVLALGPTLVLLALWPKRLDRRGPVRIVHAGLLAMAASAVVGLYVQAPYGSGSSLFRVSGADISDALDSRFGQAMLVRLAGLAVIAFLIRPVLAGREKRSDLVLLGVVGAVTVGTWPMSGHPGTTDVAPLTVVSDMAHLVAVSVWLGGLVMLALYLLRRTTVGELRAILPIWSNWATLAVTVLVLSGAAQALIEIGSVHALVSTTYGRAVLVKVGLLGLILLVANGARRLVAAYAAAPAEVVEADAELVAVGGRSGEVAAPAAGAEIDAPVVRRRLRRSVLVELSIAALVLVATSVLVQTTPARTAADDASAASDAAGLVTLTSPIYSLQVDSTPVPGGLELHLYAYTPAGAPLSVVEWKTTASLPDKNLGPITVPITRIDDSHAVAQAALTVPGHWRFDITLRISEIDEATVSTVVAVG